MKQLEKYIICAALQRGALRSILQNKEMETDSLLLLLLLLFSSDHVRTHGRGRRPDREFNAGQGPESPPQWNVHTGDGVLWYCQQQGHQGTASCGCKC